ncbi:hypothetical protein B0H13DRAFT_1870431 [Mycena leptocephala]|nr:hypothetical protein B0H13DRAFT_1870431 [Mycena leptocephala]
MSANPAHYNTADRVRFENYADSLRSFGAGLGPFPGPTPTGYREFFRVGHKYAPVPEDYPHLLTSATQPNSNQGPHAAGADISMSTAGLGIILDSQQKLFNSVLAMNKNQQFAPSRPRPDYRSYFNRGYQNVRDRLFARLFKLRFNSQLGIKPPIFTAAPAVLRLVAYFIGKLWHSACGTPASWPERLRHCGHVVILEVFK